jgi:broad specificity phosphatase PhoE
MTMPRDLVLVRHGYSEQNFALRAAKHRGDTSLFTPAFRARHGSQHRLTQEGRRQATTTGEWLHDNGLGRFDRMYTSDYVRARETAALLGLAGPGWYIDPMLREREWGDLEGLSWEERSEIMRQSLITKDTNPFYWVPPNGRSIAQTTTQLRPLFDTLHRECSDKRVIIVCHGETMWTLRFMLERMTVEQWTELEDSQEPGVKIYNCQVLHYTRHHPVTNELSPYLGWMRSVCPTDVANSGPGWQEIVRRRFSNDELLASVAGVPPLFGPEHGNV